MKISEWKRNEQNQIVIIVSIIFTSTISKGQTNQLVIQGRVNFVNEVTNPICKVVVFCDSVQVGGCIAVQSFYPNQFRRNITKPSSNSSISLKVIFEDPSDFLVDKGTDMVYHGGFVTISARRIVDAVVVSINRAKELIDNSSYLKAIDELEFYRSNEIAVNDAQSFRIAKILAAVYENAQNSKMAIETMERFLSRDSINSSNKFEISMKLSNILSKTKDYDRQGNLLAGMFPDINLHQISEARVKTYFGERFNAMPNVGKFNSYKTLPSLEFGRFLTQLENADILDKWNQLVSDFAKFYTIKVVVLTASTDSDVQKQYDALKTFLFK